MSFKSGALFYLLTLSFLTLWVMSLFDFSFSETKEVNIHDSYIKIPALHLLAIVLPIFGCCYWCAMLLFVRFNNKQIFWTSLVHNIISLLLTGFCIYATIAYVSVIGLIHVFIAPPNPNLLIEQFYPMLTFLILCLVLLLGFIILSSVKYRAFIKQQKLH